MSRTPEPDLRRYLFPTFRNVLWDRTPIAEPELIHLEQYLPSVEIPMDVLVQAVNFNNGSLRDGSVIGYFTGHWQSINLSCHVVISSFTPSHSFDNRELNDRDNHSPSSFIIKIFSGKKGLQCTSYKSTIRESLKCLRSRKQPVLSQFIKLNCSLCYHSTEECSLAGEIIAPTVGLSFTSINAIRLVSNSLASSIQGFELAEDSTGYLTLDQYRNAVPLYDSDGSVFNFPLVGIWVYTDVSSADAPLITPQIWAACLRFLYNDHIKDRVTAAAMAFLVLVIKSDLKKIQFFECAALTDKNSEIPLNHFDFGGRSICLGPDSKSPVTLKWRTITDAVRNNQFRLAFPEDDTSLRQDSSINEISPSNAPVENGMVTPEKTLPSSPSLSPARFSHPDVSVNGRTLPLPRPTPHILPYPHPAATPGPYSYENYTTPVRGAHHSSMPFASPRDLFERQQIQFEYLKEQVALLQAKFDLDNERRRQHECRRCDRSSLDPASKAVASKGTSTGVSLGYGLPVESSPIVQLSQPTQSLLVLSEDERATPASGLSTGCSTGSESAKSHRMSILELSELEGPKEELAVGTCTIPDSLREDLFCGASGHPQSDETSDSEGASRSFSPDNSPDRPASTLIVPSFSSPASIPSDIQASPKSCFTMNTVSYSDDDESDIPRIVFTNNDTSSSDQEDDESSIIARRYNVNNSRFDDVKSSSRGTGRLEDMLMREIGSD